MKYISGIHALNIPCGLNTMGDWHVSALQWDNPCEYDTEDSIFKDFGIEYNKKIPEHTKTYPVANHIRACLDLIDKGNFGYAQGMNKDFISNRDLNPIIFSKVLLLKNNKNWKAINDFMNKEFCMEWINFLKENNIEINIKKENSIDKNCFKIYKKVIKDFLIYLNKKTDMFILKDSIALMECYGLNCFSLDVLLDGPKGKNEIINTIIEDFAEEKNISFVHEKNTNCHSRYALNYKGNLHPLIINVNFMNLDIEGKFIKSINHIKVYSLNALIMKKVIAFDCKNKIRDLFDIIFIRKCYWNELDEKAKKHIKDSFTYKGYDYFEMILETQTDEFISNKELEEDIKIVWENFNVN